MNLMLARTLDFLNGVFALLIIVMCSMSFARNTNFGETSWVDFVPGALLGIVVAAVVCGLISYVSLIERHLSTIARASQLSDSRLKYLSTVAAMQNQVAEIQITEYAQGALQSR